MSQRSRGRHRKPRRPILPLWAGAILQMLDALHEQTAATAAQLADIANGRGL